MTVSDIKHRVMFQTNNDADDVGDFSPYLLGYINEGYDRLAYDSEGVHLDIENEVYVPLVLDADVPLIPAWQHAAISDYATYLVYRNGNVSKQNRGIPYLQAFNEILQKIHAGSAPKTFKNIPR